MPIPLVNFGFWYMANIPLYLQALASFDQPATARQVHQKAFEMFGDQFRGESPSARQSLDRFAKIGKAKKEGIYYTLGDVMGNSPSELEIRTRRSEEETERLRDDLNLTKKQLTAALEKCKYFYDWYAYYYLVNEAIEMKISMPEAPAGERPKIDMGQ